VPQAPARGAPFSWDRDAWWRALEARYDSLRTAGCDSVGPAANREAVSFGEAVTALDARAREPDDPVFDTLETAYFELGTAVAACPAALGDYVALHGQLRDAVKRQSRRWDVAGTPARDRLYRALYGSRAAVEEAMLHNLGRARPLLLGTDEPSAAPTATVHGVTIRSGDQLVSRGGAPTSALIARGSDYPGNFSHVGLVHVDSSTAAVSVIEAHIENGVAVATAEQYLGAKKLRVLALRPRADLPAIVADPLLPHRAATLALERARSGHVPYDFAMDYTDPSRLFCSEVASSVYHELGVTLWMGLSTISRAGLRRWLAGFGVRHFETQEPSDLEYDPQLVVVAEWRDPAWLFRDHVDNAVIDAMLEGAERGDSLAYPWHALPLARLAKAYSWVLGRLGRVGPVPEGMPAAAALRNRAFSRAQRAVASRVSAESDHFVRERGYPPPYWELVEMARRAIN
jgi:hypothetical protein